MLAGRNFWVKTLDLGNAPVRSKPLLMSSTRPRSSWPASVSSVSRRQSLLSLSTSATLGDYFARTIRRLDIICILICQSFKRQLLYKTATAQLKRHVRCFKQVCWNTTSANKRDEIYTVRYIHEIQVHRVGRNSNHPASKFFKEKREEISKYKQHKTKVQLLHHLCTVWQSLVPPLKQQVH